MKKLFLYFLLLTVPGIVGSGCLGSDSGTAPTAAPDTGSTPTTLSASAQSLVLSVNNTGLSANLIGSPRTFTITNTGSAAATSVAYTLSPALTAGTTISPANCGDLAPAATCVLTVTPGATPSATAGDVNPTAITLTFAGTNTNTLGLTIAVLTYGSVHQAGYVFAVDDATPTTGSIGGKVAALTDQAAAYPNGIMWSSDGSGATVNDDVPGIYETSTNPPDTCNGNVDGACNSQVIVTYYSPPQTNPGINRSFYAAGLCTAIIGGFSDWYLPALCEMGYDNGSFGNGCGTPVSPATQNMQTSLLDNGDLGSFRDHYWSSTEYSGSPSWAVHYHYFAPSGGSHQSIADKFQPLGVRCARAMTN